MYSSALAAGGHRVVLNGVDCYYDIRGQGPLCIFVPGGPGMAANAYGDLGGIADFVTLLTLNPRGSGESADSPDGIYRLPVYAQDLAALLDHLDRERAIILGHSHGGMVAQRFAIDYPSRVEKLILSDTTANLSELLGDPSTGSGQGLEAAVARYRDRPWFAEAYAAIQREWAGDYRTSEELDDIWLHEMPFYFYEWTEAHEHLRAERFGTPTRLESLTQFNQQEAPTMDLRRELGRITAPTLVLVGRYDFITTPQMAEDLARNIPGARRFVFEHSGHLPFFEEPALWRTTIQEFLSASSG